MTRQATTYKITPSAEISKKYSPGEILVLYKNAAIAKGVKFLAFNDSTKTFSIDSMYIPKITEILVSTGIQANFVNTFNYDDGKTISPTTASQTKVNYNPEDYTRYPVKEKEYPFLISKKLVNSPTRWTEIIREKTGMYLTSSSSTQLQVGEILLIPKSWTKQTAQETDYPPPPTDDPTKKKDGDDFLFLTALGYGIWKFIF